MLIAREKRKSNIAEYVIYMWQIEDIIRALNFDIEKINSTLVVGYKQSPEIVFQIKEWYKGIIEMMTDEDIKQKGHLQVIKNTVSDLNNLHLLLLNTPEELDYQEIVEEIKELLTDFRAKQSLENIETISDIELCFNAIYGFLFLKMQKREISKETTGAITKITHLLKNLSQKFHAIENGEDD